MDLEIYNKFLVTNEYFHLGRVKFHKEFLYCEDEEALGGGAWHIDENKDLILYSSSNDFGYASKEDILKALNMFTPEDYGLSRLKRLKINKIYLSSYSTLDLALERKSEAIEIPFEI